ncbi:hypothetical protein ASE48_08710 [Mycobacterium sp. Root265]|uniref:hypothetical protein n=1 Tax=Mycobacterium sp. Root265 TaxID=1736504 RepID=UPI00070BFF5F|nr:hypothetical protein [Mycobacterium sp. Root265]KRD08631.1 hypothetical protein ASE48_08710 [Mycobacterium sp. Root265]
MAEISVGSHKISYGYELDEQATDNDIAYLVEQITQKMRSALYHVIFKEREEAHADTRWA